jgi:hypothetical protein
VTFDELARAARFKHLTLGHITIARLIAVLGGVGYEPVLFITPDADLPDHHSLAVARGGVVELKLPEVVADVLLPSLTVEDNLYRSGKHPSPRPERR